MRLLLGDCRVNRLSGVGGCGGRGVALSEAGVCRESEEEEAKTGGAIEEQGRA